MNSQTCDLQISNFRYNKANVLGKGSTGTVYLGYDTRTGEKVAIKIIDMETIDNEVTVYLLNNQKKALHLLRHPNVVSTYEIIQNDQNCYIVGEYCSGGTLYDHIKTKGKLGEKQAIEMLKGLVRGYSQCVKFGVTHRDLKPSNVLLSDGVPKIIDFGYAEILGVQKPKIYYNVGSPSYMSPESILDNVYSEKSDIWSLGISFYQMLTGEVPIDTKDVVKVFNQLTKNGVKFPSYVSIYCREIINRCLIPNVEKRINLNQLMKLLGCEKEEDQLPMRESKRPASEMVNRGGMMKSLEKSKFFLNQAQSKPPLASQKLQASLPVQQSLELKPSKLLNQNPKQQQLKSQYFAPPPNKKVTANQHPLHSHPQQNSFQKINPKNLEIKSPLISTSKQQLNQMNKINRNSSAQKQVLVRPVSINGNLVSSINKNNSLINSRTSNGSTHSLSSAYSYNNLPTTIINRPFSPAVNFAGNKIVPGQNLAYSIDGKGSGIGGSGFGRVVHRVPVPNTLQPAKSLETFLLGYYS